MGMLSESQDGLSCCCTNAGWVLPRLLCFRFCAPSALDFRAPRLCPASPSAFPAELATCWAHSVSSISPGIQFIHPAS